MDLCKLHQTRIVKHALKKGSLKEQYYILYFSVVLRSVVDCGHPGVPDNGAVQLSATTFDSVATFQCNQGYLLVGSTRRECQSNGQWSGTQPVCNGKAENHQECNLKIHHFGPETIF